MIDDDFLVLVNAWWEPLTFNVPADLRPALGHRLRHVRPRSHWTCRAADRRGGAVRCGDAHRSLAVAGAGALVVACCSDAVAAGL